MRYVKSALAIVVMGILITGCETTSVKPVVQSDQDLLRTQADASLQKFRQQNGALGQLIEQSYAYAVFPEVTKGGVGLGGAYGRGVVYERGQFIGYTDLSQGTLGPQLGGQEYEQIILFEDKASLEHFKAGNLEFAAQASAIAADKASSTDADYERGVMVFSRGRGGLMFEAAIGGQKFRYVPA